MADKVQSLFYCDGCGVVSVRPDACPRCGTKDRMKLLLVKVA